MLNITFTAEDISELASLMTQFLQQVSGIIPTTEAAPKKPQDGTQEAKKAPSAPKPEKNPKKTDKPAPEVTEDYRIEVRRQLAALNKRAGYNRAAEIIKEQTGAETKLTEVALADLPKIMDAVKAELEKGDEDNAD